MPSLNKIKSDTIAIVDTGKAILDKVLAIMDLAVDMPALSQNLGVSPLWFLLLLLNHTGITYERLKLWLTDFFIYTAPALEIGVKAVMLTNLKNMISCSIDPRIPDQYRKQHKSPDDRNTPNEYGIDIDIESIDYLNKLNMSPLSDAGRDMYFGLDGIKDVYKFARAEDFDAFLWFVIHKGKFPMASPVDSIDTKFKDNIHKNGIYNVTPENGTLLDVLNLTSSQDNSSTILLGNTFTYDSSSPGVVSMCIDLARDEKDNIVANTLVPVSDDLTSVNWYTRKKDMLLANLFGNNWLAEPVKTKFENEKKSKVTGVRLKNKGRDFSKERAICNLQYIDQGSTDAPINGLVNNKIRFTILPKPYVHIPDIGNGEPPWRFKKILFDSDGSFNPNGKYTIPKSPEVSEEFDTGVVTFKIENKPLFRLHIKTGEVVVVEDNKSLLIKHLIECYPGLTVYEFNYDYLMGMRLFDAKVLASSLLRGLYNTNVGVNLSIGYTNTDAVERVKAIIRNIVSINDEGGDCFYKFDNKKYDELLRRTEQKKAGKTDIKSVTDILNEYDDAADLEERERILKAAIDQASVSLRETVSDGGGEFDVGFSFILTLINNLVMSIMDAILSPKVLMLFEVNQRLMGGTWKEFTIEDLLNAMQSILISIVNEIVNLLLQELLKLLMDALKPIKETLESVILRERLQDYADVINDIITNCPILWFSFGNQLLETKLDTVDYADIDTSVDIPGEKPTTNKC